MRVGLVLATLVFVLVGLCSAVPVRYMGGSFTRAHGVQSSNVAAYQLGEIESGWKTVPDTNDFLLHQQLLSPGDKRDLSLYGYEDVKIRAMAPVRNGFMAVGDFYAINSVVAPGVAFFDGEQWCALRHGLAGLAVDVDCTDDDNCFVLGDFYEVIGEQNLPIGGVVHLQYDYLLRGWVVVRNSGLFEMGSLPANPSAIVEGSFWAMLGGKLFFALAEGIVWKGSVEDGWKSFSPGFGGCTTDYDIVGNRMYFISPNLNCYSARDLHWGNAMINDIYENNLVDGDLEYTEFLGVYYLNQSLAEYTHLVVSEDESTFYLAGLYRPTNDPDDPLYVWRPWVFRQTNVTKEPEILGSYPFFNSNDLTDVPFAPHVGLDLWEGAPLVFGWFEGTDLVEDHNDTNSARPLHHIAYTALWDEETSGWVQPFGGGFVPTTNADVHGDFMLSYIYNEKTETFYFANVQAGYDILAEGAIYYESSHLYGGRNQPRAWFPLIHSALRRRDNEVTIPGYVMDILIDQQYGLVLVAGEFDYVGLDARASVFATKAGETATQDVGGGLWVVDDYSWFRSEIPVGLRTQGGVVNALLKSGGYYYAVGQFGLNKNNDILRNVARVEAGRDSAVWTDVAGGCDNAVFSVVEWNGNIYLAGSFKFCGSVEVNGIAGFNPSTERYFDLNGGLTFHAVGETLEFHTPTGLSLTTYGSKLVVGGFFASAAGTTCNGICAWDGRAWSVLGNSACEGCGELSGTTLKADPQFFVTSVKSRDGYLYAVASTYKGTFLPLHHPTVMRWNGNNWAQISSMPAASVHSMDVSPIAFNGTDVHIGIYQSVNQYVLNGQVYEPYKKRSESEGPQGMADSKSTRGIIPTGPFTGFTGTGFFRYFDEDMECVLNIASSSDSGLSSVFLPYFERKTLRVYDESRQNFVRRSEILTDAEISTIVPTYL